MNEAVLMDIDIHKHPEVRNVSDRDLKNHAFLNDFGVFDFLIEFNNFDIISDVSARGELLKAL
jgi:hypothetical protein